MSWLESIPFFRSLNSKSSAKRRRVYLVGLLLVLLLGVVGVLLAPALVGKWRSRHLTQKASAFEQSGDFLSACSMSESAYQLNRDNVDALRLATFNNARINLSKGLLYGALLFEHASATLEDQRRVVKMFLFAGNPVQAQRYAVQLLEKHPDDVDLKIVSAQTEFMTADKAEAVIKLQNLQLQTSSPSVTLALAEMLLALKDPAQKLEGQRLLLQILNSDKTLAPEALKLLSRVDISETLKTSIPDLASLLTLTDNGQATQRLNVYSIELRKNPSQKEALVDKAVAEFREKDLDALLPWLLLVGKPDLVLTLTNAKDAKTTLPRYRSYLSALLRTGRLKEADALLKDKHPGFPLLQALAVQAKLAELRGDTKDRSLLWTKALTEAQADATGQDLIQLGRLALNAGELKVGIKALTEAFNRPVARLVESTRMERVLSAAMQLGMEDEVARIAKVLYDREPTNSDFVNNHAYFDLLQNNRVSECVGQLKDLVAIFPEKLGYRTSLALGYLRSGSSRAARQLFKDLPQDLANAGPPDRAVIIAVLAASGELDQARTLKTTLNLKVLLPRERELVEKL
jgi:hypothetical protein